MGSWCRRPAHTHNTTTRATGPNVRTVTERTVLTLAARTHKRKDPHHNQQHQQHTIPEPPAFTTTRRQPHKPQRRRPVRPALGTQVLCSLAPPNHTTRAVNTHTLSYCPSNNNRNNKQQPPAQATRALMLLVAWRAKQALQRLAVGRPAAHTSTPAAVATHTHERARSKQ